MPMLHNSILCLLCLQVTVVFSSTTSSTVTTSSSTNAHSLSSNVTGVGNSHPTTTFESTSFRNTPTSSDVSITYSGGTGTTDLPTDSTVSFSTGSLQTGASTDSTVSFSFANLQTDSSTVSSANTQTMSIDSKVSLSTDSTQTMSIDSKVSLSTDSTQIMYSDSTVSLSTDSTQIMSSDSTVSLSTGSTNTMYSDSIVSLSTGSTQTMSSDSTDSLSTGSTQTMSSDSTGSLSTGSTQTMSSDSTGSLSTGSTQTMSSDSTGSLSTGSTQTMSRDSAVSLSTGSTQTMSSDSSVSLSTGSTQTMSRDSAVSLSTGSTQTMSSDSKVSLSNGSKKTMNTDSTVSLSTGSTNTIYSDSTVSLSTGSTQTMSSDSTVSLSTGSTQTMYSDSTVSLSTGSTQTMSKNSAVSLSTGSTQTMSSDSTVSLSTDSTQTVSSDSTVSLSTGSTQTVSSDSTVSLSTGSTQTVSSDSTVSLSTGSTQTMSSDSTVSSSAGSTGAFLNRNVSTIADSTVTFSTEIGVNNATTVTQTTSPLSNNGTTDMFTSSVPTSTVLTPATQTSVIPTNSTITNTTSTTSTTTTTTTTSTTTTTTTTPPHGNGTTISVAASSGGNTDISTTETTTGMPSSTTTVSLSGLLNNVNLTEVSFTYEGSMPVTQFRCQFDAMVSPYKYRVVWTVNGVTTKTDTYDSSANTTTIVLKDFEISSFMLDSQIVCSVEVLSSDESTIVVSAVDSSPLTPVQLETTTVSFQRGSSAQISILNNLYFGCYNDESCALEFLIYDIGDDYSCSDSTIAVLGETTCGISGTVKTTSDVSGGTIVAVPENMTFTITTKNDYKYRLRSSFTLKVKVMVIGSSISRTSWNGEFTQTIAVTVTEPMNLTFTDCSLSSSGRINTFDRRDFKITDSEGEFVLYRHSTYDAEVQVQTKESSFSPTVHYVNGISVRAGQDVFTISHYGTDHVTAYKSVDSSSSNLLVRKKTSTYYSILFPYGTEVHVKRYPLANDAMHVVITPSASDVMNLIGLCGNMNDDDLDDYTKRDGSTASSDTDMANSWSVGSGSSYPTENLFDTTNHASLNTWSDNHKLCVCPGGHTSTEKICGAQEDQTCSNGDKARSGSVVTRSTSSRRRRDADYTLEPFVDDMYSIGEFGDVMPRVMGEQIESHHIEKRSILYPNAVIACENGLTSSCPIFSFDWINSTEERTRIIEWCAQDMMLDNTKDWILYSCTDLQVLVLALLDRNNIFTDADPSTAASLINNNCVGNCSNLGSCSNGACTCDSGYGGPECTLNTGTAPTVHTTNNNGSVEISAGFTCLDMTTDGATDDAVCKIDVYVGLGSTTDQTISFSLSYSLTVQAIVLSYNSIQCCLPSRRRRSTTTTNQQYGISTSNNGVIFSTSVYTTILDSTCQNITTLNNSTLIILMSGYCFISGQCYTDGSANSASSCQYCTTSYSVFNWNDTCVYPTKKDDDTLEPWAIALITLSCVGVVVMTAVVAYAAFLKKKVTLLNRATRFRTGPSQRITQVTPGEEKYRGIWLRADADEAKAWA